MGVLAPNKPHKKRKKIVPFLIINNSPLIRVCILRSLPHGKNPRAWCQGGGDPFGFICYHIPMEWFFFLFQRRWAKAKEKRRPYKTTKTWKKEREKNGTKKKENPNNKVRSCTCLPTKKNLACSGLQFTLKFRRE